MKRFTILLTIVFILSASMSGCDSTEAPAPTLPEPSETTSVSTEEPADERHLKISVKSYKFDELYMPKDLNYKLDFPLMYSGLKEVTIEINGKSKPLEKAIRYGYITFDDICYYARLDAKNGVCTETYTSTNGLTKFLYSYPEFDLKIVNDIYETPDGQQHLIRDIALYSPGGEIQRVYTNPENGVILDKENWGLSFEVADASPTGMTILCTQEAGQHIGTLTTEFFLVITAEGTEPPRLDAQSEDAYLTHTEMIHNASTTQLHIDWTAYYGELPAGDYTLKLQIHDVYDVEDLHPLMKNFYDAQVYWIAFTIP